MHNFDQRLTSFLSNRKPTQHFSVSVLLAQVILLLLYRIELASALPTVIGKFPFGTYVLDGRLITALILLLLGILVYFLRPVFSIVVVAAFYLWLNFLDPAIASAIGGGRDLWAQYYEAFSWSFLLAALNALSIGLVIFTTGWVLTRAYRARVVSWIDEKGAEIAKNASDYDHTSPLAIIALVLAFIFPIGGLILAAIAKRDIAMASQKVGGVDLVVAANVVGTIFLVIQVLAILTWLNSLFELTQLGLW